MEINRSPLFYVGDKFKLLDQLIKLFPRKINNFFEPFVGGGSVFLNVQAKRYYLNDIDKNLISIHKYLIASSKKPELFFNRVDKIVKKYGLSRSYEVDIVPQYMRKKWKKTYYAQFNRSGYEALRRTINKKKDNDPLILYILLIYGFNRMLRFNGGGKFNLPVGNVDFNKNVVEALEHYFNYVRGKKIVFTSVDFKKFFELKTIKKGDFVYLDPPYLIAASEYNKIWNKKDESDLLELIDGLNKRGIKFALSNVTHYNGYKNEILIKWMKKYKTHNIKSNYINYHNNSDKKINEVLVMNY